MPRSSRWNGLNPLSPFAGGGASFSTSQTKQVSHHLTSHCPLKVKGVETRSRLFFAAVRSV